MRRALSISGSVLALVIAARFSPAVFQRTAVLQQTILAQGRGGAPSLRVDPFWPQPLPNHWVFGSVTGVAVDAQDHVWVTHRGADSLEGNEKGMMANPPTSAKCCVAAPFILEFDPSGKLVSNFGGPGQGYQWPQSPGGIAVDAKGNIWIAAAGLEPAPPGGRGRATAPADPDAVGPAPGARGRGDAARGGDATARGGDAAARGGADGRGRGPAPAGPADAHVLKFAKDGKFLLQIGTPGKMDGPDSQTTLNRPAAVAVDAGANEVFVADSGNHRIVVFDSESGAYKRHWGAYGEKPAAAGTSAYDPAGTPARQFRDVTCVEIAKDGMVYVCDRTSNRIQVFQKDGKFVKEGIVSKDTKGVTVGGQFGAVSSAGSVWDLTFSNDAPQRYVFVADGHDKKVIVLQRDTLAEVGRFGSGGRLAGQFLAVGSIAADSRGNVYTGEQHHGKRVQKWTPGR
jgi:DNA-binding beta-propeller fold protein YncE